MHKNIYFSRKSLIPIPSIILHIYWLNRCKHVLCHTRQGINCIFGWGSDFYKTKSCRNRDSNNQSSTCAQTKCATDATKQKIIGILKCIATCSWPKPGNEISDQHIFILESRWFWDVKNCADRYAERAK